jgi:hypothetical protein
MGAEEEEEEMTARTQGTPGLNGICEESSLGVAGALDATGPRSLGLRAPGRMREREANCEKIRGELEDDFFDVCRLARRRLQANKQLVMSERTEISVSSGTLGP